MYVLRHHARRLLQETVGVLASSPISDNNNDDPNDNSFDVNTRFSPSMAIILVVLLSAFFFMGFFSIYIKRCTSRQDDAARMRAGAPPRPPAAQQAQGVDAAFLESLPLVTYSASKKKGSNVECVVCLTDFNEGEPLCQLPRCKHVFHKECIDMWLFSHTTCPLCRRSVISDGSRSFRWGGGSGSLRLSLGQRGSRRDQSGRGSTTATAGPSTPIAQQAGGLSHVDEDGIPGKALSRSHSTGHSLVKQAQSREIPSIYGDTEEVQPRTGCLPLTPPAVFQRSRSVAAIHGEQVSVSTWMRGAGDSFKRALSLKRVSPASGDFDTPVGLAAAASSSARSTFDRL